MAHARLMSDARPRRAAARRTLARVSMSLDGASDKRDASSLGDEARISDGRLSDDESRMRAERSQLSPALKMEKMQLWFAQNEGIPRQGDIRSGFDMRMFWNSCCSGNCHKELFAAALTESPRMMAAHDAFLARPGFRRRERSGV